MQLWPTELHLQVDAWMRSFPEQHAWLAELLLHNLIYINENLTEELLRNAIAKFSHTNHIPYSRIAFTWPASETDDPTESGRLFSRMLRDSLNLPTTQFSSPRDAIKKIMTSDADAIVFVDDLFGSGSQLQQSILQPSGILPETTLYDMLETTRQGSYAACFSVASSTSKRNFSVDFPAIKLYEGSTLDPVHGVVAPDSIVFDDSHVAAKALHTIAQLTDQFLSIPKPDVYGLIGEGHLLIFQHGPPPDLTLPLLHTETDVWTPLKRRQ